MKFKKHILKLSILAGVLACAIVAGSLFALANTNEATSSTEEDKLNLTIVTTPLDNENNTFTVTAKIANTPDFVTANKIAGLEVTLLYDSSKITASNDSVQSNVENSTSKHNVENGTVKFVCIKNDFTTDEGYTTLSDLFTVTFTVNDPTITNPALLFNSNSVEFLIGNVNAKEITEARKVYAGDMEALALAILNKGLELVVDANVGSMIVIAPTPAANAIKEGSATINGTEVQYKTGSGITVDGKTAKVVVKGDLDGDGLVSVFDATMIKKGTGDKLSDSAGELIQGDKIANAQQAIDYIIGDTDDILVPKN